MFLNLSQAAGELSISVDTLTRRIKAAEPDRKTLRGLRIPAAELPELAKRWGISA